MAFKELNKKAYVSDSQENKKWQRGSIIRFDITAPK
jgi:hypothetical protein